MKREITALALASVALLILLNVTPESPHAEPPVVEPPALPVVKLSELDQLLQTTQAFLTKTITPLAQPTSWDARMATAANVQVVGVDEEDYVKFDGENLYVATGGKIYVVDSNLNVKASAPCPAHDCVVFVWGDSLLVYGVKEFGLVSAYLYRLPRLVKTAEFNFSGLPLGARMANGVVYIVATAPPRDVIINGVEVAEAPVLSIDVPPSVLVVAAVDMKTAKFNASVFVSSHASRIYMKNNSLYIATALGTPQMLYKAAVKTWEKLPPETRAKLDATNPWTFYKSLTSLPREEVEEVLEVLNSAEVTTATNIYIFSVDGVDIRLKTVVEVPGRILDQYAIEELDEYLLVATTVSNVKFQTSHIFIPLPAVDIVISQDNKPVITIRPPPPPAPPPVVYPLEGEPRNAVYLLDAWGRIVGVLEDLAPGERIYAARLVGRTLYLVTFRQVDPLYAIDLTNPTQPRVLGFLKTPGFSEYLHPVGDGKLLGVGLYERGVKIALFDVSDPTQPREISNITATNLYSPVFHDHHAFAYSPSLRLALVPVAGYPAGFVLAVEVGDRLSLGAVLNATADRAFFGQDAIYLVGRTQLWKYTTDLRQVATTRLG